MRSSVLLIPGMGADHTMYPRAWRTLDNVVDVAWSNFAHCESIDELALQVVSAYEIHPGDIIVGSSLGGIVGCAISKKVSDVTLILLGSAISPDEISGLASALHPLVNILPIEVILRVAGKVPGELAHALSKSEPYFIKTMCSAIFKWSGGIGVDTKCIRIHGIRDTIIPCPAFVDLTLDCGHVVALEKDEECVVFLRRF